MKYPPHILTITETTEGGITEQEYAIECPGVTDHCRMWRDCKQCESLSYDLDEDEDQQIVHGVEHRYMDERWMVRTEDCFVRDNDQLDEAAGDLELPAGVYPVDFDSGDDMCSLSLGRLTAV
ncbi:hypothetical protein O7602_26805 [Micromonospora sp. WMMD1128]|uniref:hypothetical protein n=1 Tax=Micromonospora sp. WMMD1128 TaxID=3015150 RepID=UPI00248B52EB|nr:hypothetical protein [Micromonospora sp. WMMD1128]WBB73253.1 hypothetical protein O7602_26805 [Micromonospora sp. WMMD1128]